MSTNPSKPRKQISVSQLPDRLFEVDLIPIEDSSDSELDELAAKPQKIKPLPKGKHPPSVLKRMRNLAPYKGRTAEGNRRSLANLRRRAKPMEITPPDKPTLPPVVDVDVPLPEKDPRKINMSTTIRGKYLRSVLSKEEKSLYEETWLEWMEAHEDDYVMPEDLTDLHAICMETVVQFRMLQLQRRQPKAYSADAYNQSCRRMEKARENLAARRVDREGTKARGGTNINLAVIAGNVDPNVITDKKQEQVKSINAESAFLDATAQKSKELDED